MKKLILLFAVIALIFACTKTDDSGEAFVPDPTIIAEYHIFNNNEVYVKLIFNNAGQINQIYSKDINSDIEYLYNYEFDSEQKLINIAKTDIDGNLLESQDITYNTENRVESIGDRRFEFVEDDPDYYFEPEAYNSYGPFTYTNSNGDTIEEYEISYTKYEKFPDNPIIGVCYAEGYQVINVTTGENTEGEYCMGFSRNGFNNNVTSQCGDTDCVNFTHDNSINPLYSSTNLIDVYGFIRGFNSTNTNYNPSHSLFSQNNLTLIDFSDPSYIQYIYEFNENNLPTQSTYQNYYGNVLESESVYSKYYYQGDEIPE